MTPEKLVELAQEAMTKAYCPYSGYSVGAALLCEDGTVYQGCNIENASFTPTICAERNAIFKAVYDGEREFDRIAVIGGLEGTDENAPCAPCGVCRQVMREFCNDDFEIIVAKTTEEYKVYTLPELLPEGFGGGNLV